MKVEGLKLKLMDKNAKIPHKQTPADRIKQFKFPSFAFPTDKSNNLKFFL